MDNLKGGRAISDLQAQLVELKSLGCNTPEQMTAEINNRHSIHPSHIRVAERSPDNRPVDNRPAENLWENPTGGTNFDEDEGYVFMDRSVMMRVPGRIFGEAGYEFSLPFAPQMIRNQKTSQYCGIAIREIKAMNGLLVRQDIGVYTDSSSAEGAVGGATTKATRRLLETLGDAGGLMLADQRFDKARYEYEFMEATKNSPKDSYFPLVPLNPDYQAAINDRYGLHPDHIQSEPAAWNPSKTMHYVKRPGVFRILNEVMGYAGWGTRIAHPPQFREVNGKYECVMTVGLEILGSIREETGVSTSADLGQAIMGAYTKGLKRAFSSLGNIGGLMLWNDDFDKARYEEHFISRGKSVMPMIPGIAV